VYSQTQSPWDFSSSKVKFPSLKVLGKEEPVEELLYNQDRQAVPNEFPFLRQTQGGRELKV
jgi:hypothetical protein